MSLDLRRATLFLCRMPFLTALSRAWRASWAALSAASTPSGLDVSTCALDVSAHRGLDGLVSQSPLFRRLYPFLRRLVMCQLRNCQKGEIQRAARLLTNDHNQRLDIVAGIAGYSISGNHFGYRLDVNVHPKCTTHSRVMCATHAKPDVVCCRR